MNSKEKGYIQGVISVLILAGNMLKSSETGVQ